MANEKIWGYWDCTYCDTKGIRGDKRICPNCQHRRDEHVKFYMKNTNDVITKPEDLANFVGKPDWECRYCGTYNRGDAEACKVCGADKLGDSRTYHQVLSENNTEANQYSTDGQNGVRVEQGADIDNERLEREREERKRERERREREEQEERDRRMREREEERAERERAEHRREMLIYGGVGLGILAVIGLLLFLFIPRHATLQVQSLPWERNIAIEESYISRENGWSIPPGGTEVDKVWKYHYTDQVPDGTEYYMDTEMRYEKVGSHTEYDYKDAGDGSFDKVKRTVDDYDYVPHEVKKSRTKYKDVEVYDWYYTYDIQRWRVCRNIHTNGTNDEPYWGDYTLNDGERTGARTETYNVYALNTAKDKDGYKLYDTSFDIWTQLHVNDEIEVKVVQSRITELLETHQ